MKGMGLDEEKVSPSVKFCSYDTNFLHLTYYSLYLAEFFFLIP